MTLITLVECDDDFEEQGCDECGSIDDANCTCDQLPELDGTPYEQ